MAYAINDSDVAVGYADYLDGLHHAALFQNGIAIDLGVGTAIDINKSGQIVVNTGSRIFLVHQNGSMEDLGLPAGALGVGASAINTSGQIAGNMYTICCPTYTYYSAMQYVHGEFKDIGVLPGDHQALAQDISDDGRIVGISVHFETYEDPVYRHNAFLYDKGKMQLLPKLPGPSLTWALGISKKSGVIVGTRAITPEPTGLVDWQAMAWIEGQPVDLASLLPPNSGWDLYIANAVNDAGQITGYGYNSTNREYHAFLLTPVETKGKK